MQGKGHYKTCLLLRKIILYNNHNNNNNNKNNNSNNNNNDYVHFLFVRYYSVFSIEEYNTRQKGIEKLFENKSLIVEELSRQAKKYMCYDERVKLENCIKKTKQNEDKHNKTLTVSLPLANQCESFEKMFNNCVSNSTNEKSVIEYQKAGRKGTEAMFVKRERGFEMSQATRLMFSFGI